MSASTGVVSSNLVRTRPISDGCHIPRNARYRIVSRVEVSPSRAAVFESAIGALYLDAGLEVTRRFVLQTMADTIDECAESDTHENYKSVLQQHSQRFLSASPRYESLDEQGPDHSKCFEVCVVVSGERFPSAWGPTKKQAEQSAARRALEILGALKPEPDSQVVSDRRSAE